MPCILIKSPLAGRANSIVFYMEYGKPLKESEIMEFLITAATTDEEKERLAATNAGLVLILTKIIAIFYDEKAVSISVKVTQNRKRAWVVARSRIYLDEAFLRISKSSVELDTLRTERGFNDQETKAASEGIVYWKLPGNGNLGTLGKSNPNANPAIALTLPRPPTVNGAGLAMNTVDTIASLGGRCTNFLDTGGKATKETVKTSFKTVLQDPRVNVVFVNIFGGLTLCDMIAEGIVLAYKDLGITVPVVVRLRGTNEKIGQSIVCLEYPRFLGSKILTDPDRKQ